MRLAIIITYSLLSIYHILLFSRGMESQPLWIDWWSDIFLPKMYVCEYWITIERLGLNFDTRVIHRHIHIPKSQYLYNIIIFLLFLLQIEEGSMFDKFITPKCVHLISKLMIHVNSLYIIIYKEIFPPLCISMLDTFENYPIHLIRWWN